MKTTLAILLCLAVTAQAQVKTNTPPKGLVEGIFAIGVAAVGCYCVIHCYNKSENRDSVIGPATLVLEKSEWGGEWFPVFTNTIPATTTNRWTVFEERMGDQGCRYRVKTIPIK